MEGIRSRVPWPAAGLASVVWYHGHVLDCNTVLPLKKRILGEAGTLHEGEERTYAAQQMEFMYNRQADSHVAVGLGGNWHS